jgi:phage/plasmid-associated DNA primase
MSNVFFENAPAYWEKGLPVIPILAGEKRPVISEWQTFAEKMPTPDLQKAWLKQYRNGNIGMVMGQQSGVVAMDIDTIEPKALALFESILPPSPWKRVGAKGCVYLYKYSGQKTFRIKDKDGATLIELLSHKTQIVIPPSIHPNTKKPYQENVPLLDVIDQIPTLPKDIEQILRTGLRSEGFDLSTAGYSAQVDYIPAGARDSQMAHIAGMQSRAILRGERTLKESMGEMATWVEEFTEKVCGDNVSVAKGIDRLIQFLTRDVMGGSNQNLPKGWDEGMTDEEKDGLGLSFDEDHEDWGYTKCIQYLKIEFDKYRSQDSMGRLDAIEHILIRLARNRSVSELEQEKILKWIVGTSSGSLTMAGLKRSLKKHMMGDLEGLDQTEIAREALQEMEQYGAVRYFNSQMWQWAGACWDVIDETEVLKMIAQNYGSLSAAKKFSDHRGIMSILKNLASGDLKTLNEDGINFANGFLTIEGVLEPHREEYGMTYCLPYRYLPEEAGKAHRFEAFLNSCWEQDEDLEDKKQALKEAICATLFGIAWRYQRAFLLFGAARSGKSTLLNVLLGLIPDGSWSAVSPQQWDDKFLPTTMVGKLLNYAGELSEDKFIKGDSFKTIVEGAEISGQYKGQQIFRFAPRCAHWFAANFLPRTKDTSAGFTRRWLIFHFNHPVAKSDVVLGLDDLLLGEEREAIVAWAVSCMHDLRKKSELTLPASHILMAKKMAGSNNSVRFFLTRSGKVKFAPTHSEEKLNGANSLKSIPEPILYHEYWSFLMTTGGAKAVQQGQFSMHMAELATEFGFQMIETEEKTSYAGITIVKS